MEFGIMDLQINNTIILTSDIFAIVGEKKTNANGQN